MYHSYIYNDNIKVCLKTNVNSGNGQKYSPFYVVKLQCEFNQRTESTPHKFTFRLPSKIVNLFNRKK